MSDGLGGDDARVGEGGGRAVGAEGCGAGDNGCGAGDGTIRVLREGALGDGAGGLECGAAERHDLGKGRDGLLGFGATGVTDEEREEFFLVELVGGEGSLESGEVEEDQAG